MINIEHIFECKNCGTIVGPATGKHQRNHCPQCLHSRHVDIRKGDRRCFCKGLMPPISIWVKPGGEWALIHRCLRCGFIRTNRIAGDDNESKLLELAKMPLQNLAFPI